MPWRMPMPALHWNRIWPLLTSIGGRGSVGLARYQEALPALEKAITLGAGNKLQMAYFDRGLARDYLGDLRGAYFDYKKAVELDPYFEPAKEQLARFTVTFKSNRYGH